MANGVSIFERALDRSTPGFDSLLNVIQTETNRIERNRALARQTEMKEDLLDLQAEKEISVYNETTAVQREKDRQLERDLAGVEELTKAAADAAEQNEDLVNAKEDKKEELEKQFSEVYGPLKDLDFTNIPNPEFVAEGKEVGDVQGYYRITSGDQAIDLTPQEFEEQYGWMRNAAKYVELYRDLNRDDRITRNSNAKEMGVDSITDARGSAIQEDLLGIGGGVVEGKVTKKFLGTDEAAQVIAKLRAGDREVYRKFATGQYDFNTMPKGEGDIRRSIQSSMTTIADVLQQEADEYPNAWVGLPFFDIGSGKMVGEFNVNRIAQELQEIGGTKGGKDIQALWNSLLDQYKKLKKGRKTSFSDLTINPKILTGDFTDVPVEDYFLTTEEAENAVKTVDTKQNDFELTDENIKNFQSRQLLQQAIRDSTN